MWILRLNDMRAANIENVQAIFRAETNEQIEAFLEKESVPQYRDGQWQKYYRKDGPLEWFNPASGYEGGIIDVGSEESWINDAIEAYKVDILSIPTI